MNISCEEYDRIAVITVDGELSTDTLGAFKSTIEENVKNNQSRFVISFEKVSFIDSEGLEALLWLKDKCLENQGDAKLACLDETHAKIMNMTRLDHVFDIHSQIIEAVKSF